MKGSLAKTRTVATLEWRAERVRTSVSTVGLALALWAVGIWPGTETTLAQPRGEQTEARRLYEAGLAAARSERWADARDHFSRSYSLSRDPAALFNLALAQRALGRYADALQSFLTLEAHEGLEPALLSRIARLRAKSSAAVARVTVLGLDVRRYELWIDGEPRRDSGARPLDLTVDPGRRRLRVRGPAGKSIVARSWRLSLDRGDQRMLSWTTEQPQKRRWFVGLLTAGALLVVGAAALAVGLLLRPDNLDCPMPSCITL